jgi:hypothetical protein
MVLQKITKWEEGRTQEQSDTKFQQEMQTEIEDNQNMWVVLATLPWIYHFRLHNTYVKLKALWISQLNW